MHDADVDIIGKVIVIGAIVYTLIIGDCGTALLLLLLYGLLFDA